MNSSFQRRHSRWYELIIFNPLVQFVLGFALVVLLPSWLRYGDLLLRWPLTDVILNTLLANGTAYCISFILLSKFKRYPGTQTLPFVIPTVLVSWLLVFAAFLFLREETYARQVLLTSFVLANVWSFLGGSLAHRYSRPKLAIVPFGRARDLLDYKGAEVVPLGKPDLEGRRYDAVIADLHTEDLPDDWERFLARCTLAGVPVFHSQQMIESLTGRVRIAHLSENLFGSLQPSRGYAYFKRIAETLAVLVFAPVWLPVMLITGVFIKLESEGPMFFIQDRVGQGNKDFKVYKLRSMCKDSEKNGAQFAQANDMRVTRVGRFIRKTRLDEIPQFINVLRGDMSLIGPRPEQRAFVDRFDEEVPFYAYRHVVKPGITGWAQVVHGYAADAEDTKVKLEHDFYYIKNFSLWLDVLIVVRTIKTILTGFGAR